MTSYPVPEQSPQRYDPPRPAYNPWLVRLPLLFLGGSVLLALVLGIFLIAFQMRFADKIVPGVWSQGINLGGMTREEAIRALEAAFTYPDQAVFTFRDGDRFWQMTAGELGVAFDAEATVNQAFAAGHTGDMLNDIFSQASVWLTGRAIAPIVRYDQGTATSRLLEIAATINRPAVDATLQISGQNITTTPSQTGRTLDIGATLNRLDAVIVNMTTGAEIPLVIHETPPLVWNVNAAISKARAAISGPITLVADDQQGGSLGPWVASVDQIAGLLALHRIDNGDGTQSYDVAINTTAFRSFLQELAPGLRAAPQDARFHFNETTRELEVIQPSINGRTLNIDETLTRIEQAIFTTDNRTVPVAFDYVLPRYHNGVTAASLGITEMVSEATTLFRGSTANRRHNIATAANRFDGVIIGPGEEFSFNSILGDISEETGFVDGKVIFAGRTIIDVGGGVCQASTTMFRAAINGGYLITERHSHGYRVGYYEQNSPPGFDAAIYQPTADFRFQNDTPYHLLIETSVFPGSDSLQVRFYSTNPGRRVVIEGPIIKDITPALPTVYEANGSLQPGQSLQVDWAAEGAFVTFTQIIEDVNGNEIRRSVFPTQYQPWAAVVQVAPGDARLNATGG